MNPIIVYKAYDELLVIYQDGSYKLSIGDNDIHGTIHKNILHHIVTTLTTKNMTNASYGTDHTHSISSAKGIITYNYDSAPDYIRGLSQTFDTVINSANPRLVQYIIQDGLMSQKVIIRSDGTVESICTNTDSMAWEYFMGECNVGVRHIQSPAMRDLRTILRNIPPHAIQQISSGELPITTIITSNGTTSWETKPPNNMIDIRDFVLEIFSFW